MKNKLATWLGVAGAIVGIYLLGQAFLMYYMHRFGDTWKLFIQLI